MRTSPPAGEGRVEVGAAGRGSRVVLESGPFAALELRAWTDDDTGVVDVELRDGEPALSFRAVADRFGPFEDDPHLDAAAPWFFAEVGGGPGAGVQLTVAVRDGTVTEIELVRDPVPGGG